MKSSNPDKYLAPVLNALAALGADIRNARLRRRISTAVMAQRAALSRTTLHYIERGDPGVSIAAYATVLFILGMLDRLAELADVRFDPIGLAMDETRLPKRIDYARAPRKPRPKKASTGKEE